MHRQLIKWDKAYNILMFVFMLLLMGYLSVLCLGLSTVPRSVTPQRMEAMLSTYVRSYGVLPHKLSEFCKVWSPVHGTSRWEYKVIRMGDTRYGIVYNKRPDAPPPSDAYLKTIATRGQPIFDKGQETYITVPEPKHKTSPNKREHVPLTPDSPPE